MLGRDIRMSPSAFLMPRRMASRPAGGGGHPADSAGRPEASMAASQDPFVAPWETGHLRPRENAGRDSGDNGQDQPPASPECQGERRCGSKETLTKNATSIPGSQPVAMRPRL